MCDTNKRLGFIGILVEDLTSVEKVNETWKKQRSKSPNRSIL